MSPTPMPNELEELRDRAVTAYRRSGSVDATAVELGLSLADTRSLLGLEDASRTGGSGWRIDFPPIGPPGMKRT